MVSDFGRILRQARREERIDRMKANLHRPLCWLLGHHWIYKLDLYGGALCRRCSAHKKA